MNKASDQSTAIQCSLSDISNDIKTGEQKVDDHAWIDVIQQMDNIYVELVQHQIKLEEKNAELGNAQLFIQSVVSSMSDVLIVCDINSSILQVNSALETTMGMSSADLVGKPLTCLFSDAQQSIATDLAEQIRSTELIDIELDLINIDQQAVPMAVSCSSLFDHENRLSGFVLTGRPLGELRKAYSQLHKSHEELKSTQQQLIQSEKMASLGRLVAGVAHELNNPISFVYANMHALQSYEEKFKQYLTAIHNNDRQAEVKKLRSDLNIDHMMSDIQPLIEGSLEGAERINDIVKNLRKFTTPQEQAKEIFNLSAVIERATSWVLKSAKIQPKIIENYSDNLQVKNSEGHIHQILINLIQNAVDSMTQIEQPTITISSHIHENNIALEICDNGAGIKESEIMQIFDPFFTTKPVGSGMGLGLYISYGLAVKQCSGNLAVKNHPDGGAVFTLTLPRNAS